MRNSSKYTAVAFAVASALALAACGSDGDTPPDASGNGGASDIDESRDLAIGVFAEPASFDPAQAQEGHYFPYFQAVYDTLILSNEDGALVPMLATDWSYTDEALTTFEVNLRSDVTFSDGETFDAETVVVNVEHFLAANGPQAAQATAIESVEAVDEDTVVFNLSAPDPALEYSLANALGLMASPAAVGTADVASSPIGSGPYTLDTGNSAVGTKYVFVRNDGYWGDAEPWESVTMQVLTDETARMNALRSGQINAMVITQVATADEMESSGFATVEWPNDFGGLVFFDREGSVNSAIADVRVRQAIRYAIDADAIAEQILLGRATVTSQIFGESTFGYVEELDNYYTYDPDKARELLDEAGYADGLEISMPTSGAFPDSLYTAMIQYLGDVGITATRHDYGPGEIIPAYLGGEQAAGYMTLFQPSDWQTVTQYIGADAVWNPNHNTTSEVEAWIEEIRMATSDEERQVPLQELNTYLVENAWFGTLFRQNAMMATDGTVDVAPQPRQASPSIYNYEPAA
jgi:peptide/nickel transport system substrate-binding protein